MKKFLILIFLPVSIFCTLPYWADEVGIYGYEKITPLLITASGALVSGAVGIGLMFVFCMFFVDRYRKLENSLKEEPNSANRRFRIVAFVKFWGGVFMVYCCLLTFGTVSFIFANHFLTHNETLCKMGLCRKHELVNCNQCNTKHSADLVCYCSNHKRCFGTVHKCYFCIYHKEFHVQHRYEYEADHESFRVYRWGESQDCVARCSTCHQLTKYSHEIGDSSVIDGRIVMSAGIRDLIPGKINGS